MNTTTSAQNRLKDESSPYLLQHADNPVDWFPWCEDAFKKAEEENKLIFLSIGYSSCHWCHVMAHQVFENQKAADILNKSFVSIKVDREERPDIDHLYMEACIAQNRSGGWPLSVFLTPDKRAFFTATYIPLEGFMQLCNQIDEIWQTRPQDIHLSADSVSKALVIEAETGDWSSETAKRAYLHLEQSHDTKWGGFGGAPKFPTAHTLTFLSRYAQSTGEINAEVMARRTLERMALGGLFDHIGGGFFRYSTDERYIIPHFEKMLYDNATLAMVYAQFGYTATSRRVIEFCLRELYSTEHGAFYTALDADSPEGEGRYYLFTPQEIDQVLGKDSEEYKKLFDISQKGNFEGLNHLHLQNTGPLSQKQAELAVNSHEKLLNYRQLRKAPSLDDKILLSSNSLMLGALSVCGKTMNEEKYLTLAIRLAEFLTRSMKRDRYYSSFAAGELSHHPASSDDYVYLSWGLLQLHQATLDERWLKESMQALDSLIDLFSDDNGVLFMSGRDVNDLPLRLKNTMDASLPSGNSLACELLYSAFMLTSDDKYKDAFDSIVYALSQQAKEYPTAHTALISSVLWAQNLRKVELPESMKSILQDSYPFTVYKLNRNLETATVCTESACLPPVDDLMELRSRLNLSPDT